MSVVISFNCQSGGGSKFIFQGRKFGRFDDQKSAFGYDQCIHWDIASNEKFALDRPALGVDFNTAVAQQVFKASWFDAVAYLFVYLPHHALKIRLVTFAMSTKKPHLTPLQDAGDIIALLEQKTTQGIDNDGASDLAVPRYNHACLGAAYWRYRQFRMVPEPFGDEQRSPSRFAVDGISRGYGRVRAMLDTRFTRRKQFEQWRELLDRFGKPQAFASE